MRRIVVQDMLSKGSGEHVLWPPDSGGSNHLWRGGGPVRQIHGWHWWGEAPRPVGHILGSWCWRSLVPAGFSPHPTSWAGEAAFFSSGLPRRSGMVNSAGAVNCQRIIHHLPVDLHRPAQRLLYLCRDGKGELGGEVPASARLGRPLTEFASAHFHLATDLLAGVTRPSV